MLCVTGSIPVSVFCPRRNTTGCAHITSLYSTNVHAKFTAMSFMYNKKSTLQYCTSCLLFIFKLLSLLHILPSVKYVIFILVGQICEKDVHLWQKVCQFAYKQFKVC